MEKKDDKKEIATFILLGSTGVGFFYEYSHSWVSVFVAVVGFMLIYIGGIVYKENKYVKYTLPLLGFGILILNLYISEDVTGMF